MARIIKDDGGNSVVACRASYLESAISNIDAVAHTAEQYLRGYGMFDKFDTLVGRGLSGALIAPHVARVLGKHWLIVRKNGDGTHSHERAEGTLGKAWLFFDDLICSGHTLANTVTVVKDICSELGYETTLMGAYTYAPATFREVSDLPLPVHMEPDWRETMTKEAIDDSLRIPSVSECMAEFDRLPKYAAPATRGPAQKWAGVDWKALEDFITNSSVMPTVDEVYNELKGKYYTPRPNKPKPVRRGGKARRQLDQLKEMQAAQQAALNAKMDTICQQMINALESKR